MFFVRNVTETETGQVIDNGMNVRTIHAMIYKIKLDEQILK